MQKIANCLQPYVTAQEADVALGSLPETLADFYVVDLFLLENGNGGMHQYIFNSSGMMATRLATILDAWELPDHAQAVRNAMSHFPSPYPRDTQKRRAVMAGFSAETDQAINLGTWIGDDPAIWDKVQKIAIREGYWPQ